MMGLGPLDRRAFMGDLWGGLAAMLVALPAAVAFGVAIFSPLGGSLAAQGALAGVLGASVLGLVVSAFGSSRRLITAPCAPAAAMLSAAAITFSQQGLPAETVLLLIGLIGLLAGLIQVAAGLLKLGQWFRAVSPAVENTKLLKLESADTTAPPRVKQDASPQLGLVGV